MLVQQAIFTSARTCRMSGYQLVARSENLGEEVASALSLWGPTHDALIQTGRQASWSYFPLGSDRDVVARTVHGGAEYSERGGRQIVTRFLVLTGDQYRAYGCHALHLLRTAITLGHLRLPDAIPARLPPVELPDWGLQCTSPDPVADAQHRALARDALARIQRGRRVALIGDLDPSPVLEQMYAEVAPAERRRLSFSTALRVSIRRCCRLCFLPGVNTELRAQFEALAIDCLGVASLPASRRDPGDVTTLVH